MRSEDELLEMLTEARIRKIVNRRGQITKRKTAGRKGKKVDSSGRVKTLSGKDKRKQRMGQIKRRKTLKRKSSYKKRKSAMFAAKGRERRRQMGTKDNRKG